MKDNFLLFSKIFSCGVSILTAGGMVVLANTIPYIEGKPQEIVIETQIEDKQEEPKKEQSITEESGQGEASGEKVEKTSANTPEKSAISTKPVQTSTTNTSKSSTQAQPTKQKFYVISDFEHAYLGVCPQNVPKEVWSDPLRPIVSLGYRPEEKFGPFSMETAVAVWWSSYKQGTNSPSYIANIIGGNQINGNSCGQGTNDTLFKMNYTTLTVYWEDNAISPDGKEWADQQSQYMTNFLRSIDSQFKTKCGY